MYRYVAHHLMYNLLAGDATVQAAFTLKPCAHVKNLSLDHSSNLSFLEMAPRLAKLCIQLLKAQNFKIAQINAFSL